MSVFTLVTAAFACLAPLVSAYTQPTGSDPVGNPFSAPGLGSTVPVGQSFTVQWSPTTSGTVTLVLLKGPANQLSVVGPIANSIDNTGSFAWMPSTDLTEGPTSTTGYGIQLIVDSNGQYQYTTQFGISNPASGGSSNSSGASSSAAAPASSVVVIVASSAAATGSASVSAPAMTSAPPTSNAVSATTSTDSAPVVVTLPTTSATTLLTAPATNSIAASTSSRPARSTGVVASASSSGSAAQATAGLLGFAALAGAAVLAI